MPLPKQELTHGEGDPSTKVHSEVALVGWWDVGSFFSSPQCPSRGLKWGDTEIGYGRQRGGELAMGKCVGNDILFSWDVKDTKLNVVGEEDVDAAAQQVVVGWQTGKGVKYLNQVQVICVNHHAG